MTNLGQLFFLLRLQCPLIQFQTDNPNELITPLQAVETVSQLVFVMMHRRAIFAETPEVGVR